MVTSDRSIPCSQLVASLRSIGKEGVAAPCICSRRFVTVRTCSIIFCIQQHYRVPRSQYRCHYPVHHVFQKCFDKFQIRTLRRTFGTNDARVRPARCFPSLTGIAWVHPPQSITVFGSESEMRVGGIPCVHAGRMQGIMDIFRKANLRKC